MSALQKLYPFAAKLSFLTGLGSLAIVITTLTVEMLGFSSPILQAGVLNLLLYGPVIALFLGLIVVMFGRKHTNKSARKLAIIGLISGAVILIYIGYAVHIFS